MLTLPNEKGYLLELLTETRFFRVQGQVKIILDRLEQVTKSRDFLNIGICQTVYVLQSY